MQTELDMGLTDLPAANAAQELSVPGRERLRQIVEANYDFIWRLLRRFGVAAEAVDDAAQEVFMVAMRRIDSIETGAERSFLFGTALRVASDRRRARARSREVQPGDLFETASDSPAPDELTDDRRARAVLDRVLESMQDDLRTVFILFELEGMTTLEIAAMTGIPHGTASSRLRRAREEFSKVAQRFRARHEGAGGRS